MNITNIYQIILLGLFMLSLGITLARHGEPKNGNENFWSSLLGVIIHLFLLIKGGFFK